MREALVGFRDELRADERRQKKCTDQAQETDPEHDAARSDRRQPKPSRALAIALACRVKAFPEGGNPEEPTVLPPITQGKTACRKNPPDQSRINAVENIHQSVGSAHQAAQHWNTQQPGGWWVVPNARQHRIQGETHKQAHQYRNSHGDSKRIKETADDAAHERHWHKDSANRKRGGHHCQANFLGALARRHEVVFAHAHMPNDVLAHHDGIVDQQADTERERHHRHEVQREAKGIDGDKTGDNRDRQSQTGDDGRAPRVEKEKNDGDSEQRPLHQRALHTIQ